MFRLFFLIFIVVGTLSCYHENKEIVPVPAKLLTKEQMIDILTDIQLSEGILTYRRINKLPVKDYGEAIYSKVITEHNITREQLQENIDYYNGDPKLMEKIYDDVLARLNKMQTELMILAAKSDSIAAFKNDSILMLDSTSHFHFINLVIFQNNDSVSETNDSVVNWQYKKWIKVPGFIY